MSFVPRIHEIYKHFKGDLYQITAIAEHTETGEMLVVYQAMYGEFKTYARPLSMFVSRVDKEKYPDATQEFRFELQGSDAGRQRAECGENATLDPLLLEFLDSDSYGERLNILAALQHRITNEMLTTMAFACDVEIEEGDLESRYEALRNCLLTLERYECNRLR